MTFRDRLKKPRTCLIVAATAFLGVSTHWCRDYLVIDSCLDEGYAFNYVEEVCDSETLTHPVIPYSERHPGIIRAGVVGIVLGLAVAALAAAIRHAMGTRQQEGGASARGRGQGAT